MSTNQTEESIKAPSVTNGSSHTSEVTEPKAEDATVLSHDEKEASNGAGDGEAITEKVSSAVASAVESVVANVEGLVEQATELEDTKAGEKRKTDKAAESNEKPVKHKNEVVGNEAKKQKTSEDVPAQTDAVKRGPGRPKGTGSKKEKKVPTVGKAERRTRSQTAA